MKRNVFIGLITSIFVLSLASCSVVAPEPDDLPRQLYKEAVNNNVFTGTYEEWLESLKGSKGDKGDAGDIGQTGPEGPQGEQGPAGNDGKDGINGKSAYELYVEQYPGYIWGQEQWVKDLGLNQLKVVISFDTFGGKEIEPLVYCKGEEVKINQIASKEHYSFIGWYSDIGCTKEINYEFVAEKSLTLYAGFQPCEYTVTWKNYNGAILDEEQYTYGSDPMYKKTEPTYGPDKSGIYKFIGWDKELEKVTDDVTYTACYSTSTSYQVLFQSRININTHVYLDRDYSKIPSTSKTAYARDEYGNMTNSGTGEVNFEAIIDENHVLGTIVIEGQYKDVQEVGEKNGYKIYRISGITSDLNVSFLMKEKTLINENMIKDVSLFVDTNEANVGWSCVDDIDYIEIYQDDVLLCTVDDPSIDKTFNMNITNNVRSTLKLKPFDVNGKVGWTISLPIYSMTNTNDFEIPQLVVNTKDNILPSAEYVVHPDDLAGHSIDNNEYVNAKIELLQGNGDLVFSTDSILGDADNLYSGGKIKLRGNTSAYFNDKKPYKIKFNKKVDVLNKFYKYETKGYKTKSWVLLSQGELLRYFFAREVSRFLGEDYDIRYYPVNVFINGNYAGMYYLSDAINDASCGIGKTGYVIEHDPYWWKEPIWFSSPISDLSIRYQYTFKEPDADDLDRNMEEYSYIKNYVSEFESLLIEGDEKALDYIDIDSFVSWLLTHDILGIGDCEGSNRFLVKADNADSKLKAGPSWDMETIFDPQYENDVSPVHNWDMWYFPYLFKYDAFKNRYIEIFSEKKNSLLPYIDEKKNDLHIDKMSSSIDLEHDYFGFNEQYDFYYNKLENRIAVIDDIINNY